MAKPQDTLLRLNENLDILREREAKYGGNAPLDLMHQIADHKRAISLTKQVIRGELDEVEWREELRPLLVAIEGDQPLGDKFFSIFKDNQQLIIFLSFILLVGAGIGFAFWWISQPQYMEGDFNIAVAQFGEITDEGVIESVQAAKISNSLFNYLDSEYKATDFGLEVQATHKNIPIIFEDLEAEALAQRINADVVIYGNVSVNDGVAEFCPRFYVADHPDTQELTGQNKLAHPIEFNISELGFQDEINRRLRGQASILVSFTEGLVYLSSDNLDGATNSFQQAINEAEHFDPFPGMETLYLLFSVPNRLQKNYSKAVESLNKALLINPENARAYIGLGNIYYDQAILDWDQGKLEQALTNYEKALTAQYHPPGAYVKEKVNVSMGNIYIVQAQLNEDSRLYSQAILHYDQVIARYKETENSKVRQLASVAYFGLGAAYERQGDNLHAMSAYEQCIKLTDNLELQSRAETQLSLVKNTGNE